jgi:hypothetical protein
MCILVGGWQIVNHKLYAPIDGFDVLYTSFYIIFVMYYFQLLNQLLTKVIDIFISTIIM